MADLHTRLSARIGPADMVRDPYLYLAALVAVLDKCRQMRTSGVYGGGPLIVGAAIADQFELVIAEALGVPVEEPTS